MSAADDSQAGQGRSGGRGLIVAQWQLIQTRTSWLYTPAALERWWVQVPATLRRYSPVLSTAWVDGMYLTAWPRLAMLLSMFSAVFGLFEGASHWSLLTIASPPAITFAQMLPLLLIATAVGALSANAGLMLVLGYAIGDFFFAGPQLRIGGDVLLPEFFYLRVPQLISYIFFFVLAAIPVLMTKYLLSGLNRRIQGTDIPAVVLRTGAAALVQAALVYGWTLSAVMVIRILWAWVRQNPPFSLPDYLQKADPWLPMAAAAAVLLRGWLTFRARNSKDAQNLAAKLLVALQKAEQRPAFTRRLPEWGRVLLTAGLMTLLTSGYINSLVLGAVVLVVFAGILLARTYLLAKLSLWLKWTGLVGRVPGLVRVAGVVLGGYLLTRLVLSLPGQSTELNRIPGQFGAELVSIALGLLVAVALLPQPSGAGAQGGIAPKPGATARAAQPFGLGARLILLVVFVLLFSSYAYAGICLDPVCCFGSDRFTALAVAGLLLLLLILIFWPELVLLGTLLWPFIDPIFAIAAGAQGIINEALGTLLGPLLGDLFFPASALPAVTTDAAEDAAAIRAAEQASEAEAAAEGAEARAAEAVRAAYGESEWGKDGIAWEARNQAVNAESYAMEARTAALRARELAATGGEAAEAQAARATAAAVRASAAALRAEAAQAIGEVAAGELTPEAAAEQILPRISNLANENPQIVEQVVSDLQGGGATGETILLELDKAAAKMIQGEVVPGARPDIVLRILQSLRG